MNAALERQFLDFSVSKLRQLSSRIATCLGKLSEQQVWARGSENENAIGNLVLHLCGNVRQWIVSGVGGRPDVRDRDSEFNARGDVAIPELTKRLSQTVEEAAAVIAALSQERLSQRVTIQKYDVSALEAVYHVVEHFSMHAGQILFATKMMTGEELGFYRHLRSQAPHGQKTP
jgi:uncharacterized damage-inducible protein DinB